MFISGLRVGGPFHKRLPRHIFFAEAVEYDVGVKIAAVVVAVRMRGQQNLMAREKALGKRFGNRMGLLRGQAAFRDIFGIKTQDVLVGLDLAFGQIFVEAPVELGAFGIEGEGVAAKAGQDEPLAQNHIAIFIEERFLGDAVMFEQQIALGRAVVTVSYGDVLVNSRENHRPSFQLHISWSKARKWRAWFGRTFPWSAHRRRCSDVRFD